MIPKALNPRCLCGEVQNIVLTFDVYSPAPLDQLHMDFVYCVECQAPIAFELPAGLRRRDVDRYSVVTIFAGTTRRVG